MYCACLIMCNACVAILCSALRSRSVPVSTLAKCRLVPSQIRGDRRHSLQPPVCRHDPIGSCVHVGSVSQPVDHVAHVDPIPQPARRVRGVRLPGRHMVLSRCRYVPSRGPLSMSVRTVTWSSLDVGTYRHVVLSRCRYVPSRGPLSMSVRTITWSSLDVGTYRHVVLSRCRYVPSRGPLSMSVRTVTWSSLDVGMYHHVVLSRCRYVPSRGPLSMSVCTVTWSSLDVGTYRHVVLSRCRYVPTGSLKLYYGLNLSILEMFCSSHLFGCYCYPAYVCHLV